MARWFVVMGIILVLIGVAWPWLSKWGLGHLPGDFRIQKKGFTFYFPLTSSLIISLVLSVLFWIFRK